MLVRALNRFEGDEIMEMLFMMDGGLGILLYIVPPIAGFLLLMYFFGRNAKEADQQRWQKYNQGKKTNEYHGPPFE